MTKCDKGGLGGRLCPKKCDVIYGPLSALPVEKGSAVLILLTFAKMYEIVSGTDGVLAFVSCRGGHGSGGQESIFNSGSSRSPFDDVLCINM